MKASGYTLINSKIPKKLHCDMIEIMDLNNGTVTRHKIVERGIELALRELRNGGALTRREIVKIVAKGYGLLPAELYGQSRKRNIVKARYAAIRAMSIIQPDVSSPEMGRTMGKDHTTVLRALDRIPSKISSL